MKVALVGFARATRDLAPWDDPSWEIWGVNSCWSFAKRATRWFDLHSPWIYEWELRRAPGHLDWLRSFAGPVYLTEARSDIPNSVTYPLDAVIRHLGRPYLTSSVSMMLALAIHEGATEIGCYGIELVSAGEYADQRPGFEYLLGRAEERGITLHLPASCALLSGAVYGRGDLNPGGERISPDQFRRRFDMLTAREKDLVVKVANLKHERAMLAGGILECEYILSRFSADTPAVEAYRARMLRLREKAPLIERDLVHHEEQLGLVRGGLNEAKYWASLTPEGAAQERFRLPGLVTPAPRPSGLRVVAGEAG